MNTPLIQEFIKIRKGAVLALGVLLASLFMVGTASAAVTNVSLSSGVLTIVCDNANDTVQFQQWGGTAGQPLTYNTRVGVGPNVNGYNLLATWSGQNGVPVSGGTITGVRKVVIMGGGGDDNLSVNTTTPAGTVIELFGEAGNDTLSGGNNTNELLVGGAGDDTLNGGNGNDTLYGDDVPTQTFSSADPFTTAGNSSGNGFGAPWVNIQPGSLFNQRQVARFNSAGTGTASVGSGAWTAFLPKFVPGGGSNSASVLTYRQDNSYSTIDLSGIASVSFDITVTGSVTGSWNLMDANGYIAEVPAGFALSAGTHTVTLDLSTAAIDSGFDLSAVREMRIWISAASNNSSVAVSNLRYGVIPATLVTTDADPFTTTATPGGAAAVWTDISDSLFAERRLQRFNQANTSLSGGFWNFTLQGTNATSYSYLHYRMDGSGGTTDLSGVSSMSVDFSNVTGSTTFSWYFVDINDNYAYQADNYSVTSDGTVTFNMSTAQSDAPGFDWSQVVSMHLDMSRTTGANTSASAKVSNFDVTSGAPETGGNDVLNSGGGADKMFGQGGNDILRQQRSDNNPAGYAGLQGEIMVGGSGDDIFWFESNAGGPNFLMGTISDFTQGTDKIRLTAAPYTLNPATATVVNAATVPGNNKIAYDDDTFDTTIRLHPSLNLQIRLMGFTGTPLTLADFELF